MTRHVLACLLAIGTSASASAATAPLPWTSSATIQIAQEEVTMAGQGGATRVGLSLE